MPFAKNEHDDSVDGETFFTYDWTGYLLYYAGTQNLAVEQRFETVSSAFNAAYDLIAVEGCEISVCEETWALHGELEPHEATGCPGIDDAFENECLSSEIMDTVGPKD